MKSIIGGACLAIGIVSCLSGHSVWGMFIFLVGVWVLYQDDGDDLHGGQGEISWM